MKQRSVLWVVLAVLVVGAGAVVVAVGGGSGGGDDSPPQLPLAAGGGGSGDGRAEMAADAAAIGLASVYVAGDDLPALGGEAPAYRLSGATRDDVSELADALGIDGEPTETGGSWHVDDGEMALDLFGTDGSWSAYRMVDPSGTTTVSPDVAVSSEPATGSGSGGGTSGAPQGLVGQTCPGSDPGADNVVSICEPPLCPAGGATPPPTSGCEPICLDQPDVASDAARCEPPLCPQYAPGGTSEPASDAPCVAPVCPGNGADDFRCIPPTTTPAEPRPADPDPKPTEPSEPVPTTTIVDPPPAPDLPSEEEARSAALDLLAATGADVDDAKVTLENMVSSWWITVEPRVDDRAAPGLSMYVGVGPEGKVDSASGHLTEPEELGDYPLIETGPAVDRLNEGWGFATTRDVTAAAAAESGNVASAPAEDGRDAPVSDGDADAAVEEPAGAAEEPPVMTIEPPEGPGQPPEPTEVEVTDAEIVLVTVPSWDDSGTYLVPGYRFTAADESRPTVPAVTDDVLEPPPDEPAANEAPQTLPAEAPAGTTNAGAPVEVALYHCGFEELRHGDRRWVVEDPPFDETNAPPEFVGKGTFAPDDTGQGVYTDESGIAVTFTAVDEDWAPPPCD